MAAARRRGADPVGGAPGDPGAPVLALDVGGTKTIVAAVDGLPTEGLRPLRHPVTFATPRDPDAFLGALTTAAERVLPAGARPVAVGIGVPGPLDPTAGIVEFSTNLGWRHLPLAALVSERFGGVPTVIEDDANSGALGEAIAGAGRGSDPFAYLALGTGLGSGVIVAGQVVSGAHGAAGEVGHMAVHDRLGPHCNCGRYNCVEAWCSGIGLARRARETWPAARLRGWLSGTARCRRGLRPGPHAVTPTRSPSWRAPATPSPSASRPCWLAWTRLRSRSVARWGWRSRTSCAGPSVRLASSSTGPPAAACGCDARSWAVGACWRAPPSSGCALAMGPGRRGYADHR